MHVRPIAELIKDLRFLDSEMKVDYAGPAPSLIFSNTGRRGDKFFSITLGQLLDVLIDIKRGFSDFAPISNYDETPWRDKFSKWIRNPVVHALSTVQTLPLYALINKIIHVSNGLPVSEYKEKNMKLTMDNLDFSINYIKSESDRYIEPIVPELNQGSIDSMVKSDSEVYQAEVGCNIIYYGAPGTGKSFLIDKVALAYPSIKTVFHPDTQYSDFVGALKPVMSRASGLAVGYEFRPGPFVKAFIAAKANPNTPVYLIIEEINRASAAAVFGELFQLLDRKPDGESQYSIDIADPDMLDYINTKLVEHHGLSLKDDRLDIPRNLSILASMNSSDQAVMPMDTAFKRRWKFVYLPISYSDATQGIIVVNTRSGSLRVSWAVFAEVINTLLIAEQVPEDRLLGHRFLAEHELSSDKNAVDALKGKLLMYLWDDVLRHRNRDLIFSNIVDGDIVNTFGQLAAAFDAGKAVFSDAVEESLVLKCSSPAQGKAASESTLSFV